jgi:PAS domain S-box-containing protein
VTKSFLEMDDQISVETEQDAVRALERIAAGHLDIIISDYQMPAMDGIELLKKVRLVGDQVPFILFTGRGREDVAIQALNSGADFYLQKGGDPSVQFGELRNALFQLGEKVRAQTALRESENKYRQLVESASSIIMKVDLEGRVRFVNGYGLAFFGLAQNEVWGVNAAERFFEVGEELGGLRSFIVKLKADPSQCFSVVYRGVKMDEEETWISWTLRAIVDPGGEVQELLCIGNDVTSRVRAEKELERSYALIRTTLESIEEGVVVIDASGHIELYNDNFVRMLGIPPTLISVRAKEPVVSFISTHASNWQSITRAIRDIKENPLERSFDVLEFKDGRVLEVNSIPRIVSGQLTGRVWSFRYAMGSKREVDIPFSYHHKGA